MIKTIAKNYPENRVSTIAFGGDARLLHAPIKAGTGQESLLRSLQGLGYMDWTNFTAALTLAHTLLFPMDGFIGFLGNAMSRFVSVFQGSQSQSLKTTGGPQEVEVHKRIVLLTDGEHTKGQSPLAIAGLLKEKGVVIDCIGIGGNPAAVDEDMLKAIASRNPDKSYRYCFINNRKNLIRKYQSLAHCIRPV
ncbi:VWA domain-containing protein [Planctomycetota bacterium]